MNVLLVEPYYKRDLLPLGLMKIARYHTDLGDKVKYIRGEGWFINDFNPELIYITSLFSWDIDIVIRTIKAYQNQFQKANVKVGGSSATINAERIVKETGIIVHKGLLPECEDLMPLYEMFPDTDYFFGFTTRGCTNKCPFCIVWRTEPQYFEKSNWFETMIDINLLHKKDKLIIMDNNFTACSKEHFHNVCTKLSNTKLLIDFNQGLDCRLFDIWMCDELKKIKLECLRFAFDGMHEDVFIQNAINIVRRKLGNTEIRVYMLYNFNETIDEIYYRLSQLWLPRVKTYPMKYQPLDTKEKGIFIGKYWTEELIASFVLFLNSKFENGIVFTIADAKFEDIFGKNAEEFKLKLESYKKNGRKKMDEEEYKSAKRRFEIEVGIAEEDGDEC